MAYPNPTSGDLHLKGVGPVERVIVRALDGRSLFDGPLGDLLDMEHYAAGIYHVEIQGPERHVRVVKQ